MKVYQAIPIHDCGEPLQPIPVDRLAIAKPHPYIVLGAPYGDRSPYWLRSGVLTALLQAQAHLDQERPGWKIQIFDAYRPVAVQQFMVDYTFRQLLEQQGWSETTIPEAQRSLIRQQVYQFWAPPSPDLATPPPHSTGAALDVTLVNDQGEVVNMGSPIDEVSPRSFPNHFATSEQSIEQQWHSDRCYLNQLMSQAGFRRHPNEWWHFSLGDQYWAWLERQATGQVTICARYGGI